MGHRTFAEMLEAIKQFNSGMVTEAELILALQCDAYQVSALIQINKLPPAVLSKISVTDWDDYIECERERNQESDYVNILRHGTANDL